MAVKKNPDWHVWLGDILYWIRTPPGIYISIISVLVAALWYSLSTSSPPKVVSYNAPQIARAPAVSQPLTSTTPPSPCDDRIATYDPQTRQCLVAPAVSLPPTSTTPPGPCDYPIKTYDPQSRLCLVIHVGTRNNCPLDTAFISRLGGCIPLDSSRNWMLSRGDQFILSGIPTTRIDVSAGLVQFRDNATGRETLYGKTEELEAYGPSTTTVTGVADESRLYISFGSR